MAPKKVKDAQKETDEPAGGRIRKGEAVPKVKEKLAQASPKKPAKAAPGKLDKIATAKPARATNGKAPPAKTPPAKTSEPSPAQLPEKKTTKPANDRAMPSATTSKPDPTARESEGSTTRRIIRVSSKVESTKWESRKQRGEPPGDEDVAPKGVDAVEHNLGKAEAFFIKQRTEVWEAITSCDTKNHYYLYNESGKVFMEAVEESDFIGRWCLGRTRALTLEFIDGNGSKVLTVKRPYSCKQHQLHVILRGKDIGRVIQSSFFQFTLSWDVEDAEKQKIMKVKGTCCGVECCQDFHFEIFNARGDEIGQITRKFHGRMKNLFTDAQLFGAEIPSNIPLEHKLLLVAATLSIDLMLFQNQDD